MELRVCETMGVIETIEQAIMKLEGGTFQRLANAYLRCIYDKSFTPYGSKSGSNKSKTGTPDSYVRLESGEYIFVECTTQQDDIVRKFSDDIAKCLSEDEKKVSAEKIRMIVLCCTLYLSSAVLEKLYKLGRGKKVKIFQLSDIAGDIAYKYTWLCEQYLGFSIGSGQIVSLEYFLELYEKPRLATSLQTQFLFREDKKNEIVSALQDNDIVIVTGKPGVGKSRTAIEAYRELIKNNSTYEGCCIFNKGMDLQEDKIFFSRNGHYLIFVDDVNRISQFNHLLNLFYDERENQKFKIIATVRGYAAKEIIEQCAELKIPYVVDILSFSSEQTKQFLLEEFEIGNNHYLERIWNISQGNPRLAVMAAKVAIEKKSLSSISNASDLYDDYFSSVKEDLRQILDDNVLKVAGIISFYRIIDGTSDVMSEIQSVFKVSQDEFWHCAKKLHQMEIVDIYKNEIVKVSDQILSTYMFYLAFFKENVLGFSLVLNNIFPQRVSTIIDALTPVLNVFQPKVEETIRCAVNEMWDETRRSSENDFVQLVQLFWFCKRPETLAYIQERINMLQDKIVDASKIKFDDNSEVSNVPNLIKILGRFYYDEDHRSIAIDLLLDYVSKKPEYASSIAYILKNEYSYSKRSVSLAYIPENDLFDILIQRTDFGKNYIYSRLFIEMAECCLDTEFKREEDEHKNKITIINLLLEETPQLRRLRNKIIKHIFMLYEIDEYQDCVLDLLFRFMRDSSYRDAAIIKNDFAMFGKYFQEKLQPDNIKHCYAVNEYIKLYSKDSDVDLEKVFNLFDRDFFAIYNVLTVDLEHLSLWEKFRDDKEKGYEYKKNRLCSLFSEYSREEYGQFFRKLYDMVEISSVDHDRIELIIQDILGELIERSLPLFYEILTDYLKQGDCFNLRPYSIIKNILNIGTAEEFFNIVVSSNIPNKGEWLLEYYWTLPKDKITQDQARQVLYLYETEKKVTFFDKEQIIKYEKVNKGFFIKILKIIISRCEKGNIFSYILSNMYDFFYRDIFSVQDFFPVNDIKLFERGYFSLLKTTHQNPDRVGKILELLIDIDMSFIDRFFTSDIFRNVYSNINFGFIWRKDNYNDIMSRITSIYYNIPLGYSSFYYKRCYMIGNEELRSRQDGFLLEQINTHAENKQCINLLFCVISDFGIDRRLQFYRLFLDVNKEIEHFKELPFSSSSQISVGSWIPMIEERINLCIKVQKMCDSRELLQHRSWMQKTIDSLREGIEKEKRREYLEKD